MKVAFFLLGYDSHNGPAMTGKYLLNQINKEIDMELITTTNASEEPKWFLSERVNVYRIVNPWKFPISLYKIRKIAEDCDLVHIQTGSLKLIFPVLNLCEPVLIGNCIPWSSKWLKPIVKIYNPYIWGNNLHHYRFFPDYDKMAFFPHGIDLSHFEKGKNKDIDVLWVGHMNPHKRPNLALDTIQMMDEPKAVIVGSGPIDSQIKERCSNIRNCNYVGHVSHRRLKGLYERAKISLITSELEGSSHVAVESIAAGLPIVSCTEFYADVLGEHSIKVEERPADLAKACKDLLRNDNLRKKMSKKAREHAEETFDARRFGRDILDLYRKIKDKEKPIDYSKRFIKFYASALQGDNLWKNYYLRAKG